jgi:hypothetical protein
VPSTRKSDVTPRRTLFFLPALRTVASITALFSAGVDGAYQNQALAARCDFRRGEIFSTRRLMRQPAGCRFVAWLGQVQWATAHGWGLGHLAARRNSQPSRSCWSRLRLGDICWCAATERTSWYAIMPPCLGGISHPAVQHPVGGCVQLAPFIDYGYPETQLVTRPRGPWPVSDWACAGP